MIIQFASVDDYANAVASYAEDPRGEVDPLVLWGVNLYEVWKSDWQEEKSLADAFRFVVIGKVLDISWAKLTSIASETPSSSFNVNTPSSRVFWALSFKSLLIAMAHLRWSLLPKARFRRSAKLTLPSTTRLVCYPIVARSAGLCRK